MYGQIFRRIRNLRSIHAAGRKYHDINPEDILMDATNLPGFNEYRLEGRIEKPVGKKTFVILKLLLTVLISVLIMKLWLLGVTNGSFYLGVSENNRLEQTIVFANRGLIYDRNMLKLAINEAKSPESDFAGRLYSTFGGLAHVVGYLKYPLSDQSGNYYDTKYRGRDGVERAFDSALAGKNGLKLRETDVFGNVTSESIVEKAIDGNSLVLSVDARLTDELYKSIEFLAKDRKFVGGAGVILDIETGEIIAMTSFPEYDSNSLTKGTSQKSFNLLLSSSGKPFLNRAIGGLYTPGSILKPIVALAALNEKLISPTKEILSTGSISVPNPFDPDKPTIFKDWRAHGWADMRKALAVSSDTYFYAIGGGLDDQKGLGILTLDRYFELFGLSEKTGVDLNGEVEGVIASPEWKKEKFNGEIWRIGDTYITSIGQYGTQITPLNAARFIAAVANGGKLLKPSIILGGYPNPVDQTIESSEENWKVVREGMREGVTYGTSIGLNVPYINVAAKTGTAEVGSVNLYVNSWSVGFFPYDHPRYAWAVVMERGPSSNSLGATTVLRRLFDWMSVYTPQYFE